MTRAAHLVDMSRWRGTGTPNAWAFDKRSSFAQIYFGLSADEYKRFIGDFVWKNRNFLNKLPRVAPDSRRESKPSTTKFSVKPTEENGFERIKAFHARLARLPKRIAPSSVIPQSFSRMSSIVVSEQYDKLAAAFSPSFTVIGASSSITSRTTSETSRTEGATSLIGQIEGLSASTELAATPMIATSPAREAMLLGQQFASEKWCDIRSAAFGSGNHKGWLNTVRVRKPLSFAPVEAQRITNHEAKSANGPKQYFSEKGLSGLFSRTRKSGPHGALTNRESEEDHALPQYFAVKHDRGTTAREQTAVAAEQNLAEALGEFFLRQARLPPSGGSAFDPRLTPAWAGLAQAL